MSRRPELGYFEGGLDLCDRASYAGCVGEVGQVRMLPPAAYHSLTFAYLEDERIWTRDWVCIGTLHDIAQPGDLLPYTLGNHGIHVQRQPDGSLRGAFNMAQHGGCRTVPVQCQGGRKTSCSFTSCGYSRDRTPIPAGEPGEGTAAMHQYLGLRPERLLPVSVEVRGALILVNLDPQAAPLDELPMPDGIAPDARRIAVNWCEYQADWKLLAQHLLGMDSPPTATGTTWLSGHSGPIRVQWWFPNLLLFSRGGERCLVLLQPTALGETLCRIQVFSKSPLASADADVCLDAWLALIARRGGLAVDQARELRRLEQHSASADMPRQNAPAGLWGQQRLVERVTAQTACEGELRLYGNLRNYLI